MELFLFSSRIPRCEPQQVFTSSLTPPHSSVSVAAKTLNLQFSQTLFKIPFTLFVKSPLFHFQNGMYSKSRTAQTLTHFVVL